MQFEVGDLVILKDSKDFPDCAGSLTAVKFYKRLINECQNKLMLIIKITNCGNSIVVLVSGYRKVIGNKFLTLVNNKNSEEIHEFKKV